MEQENIYENEIDLKELLYVIFRKWRGLIVCALIFAALAGGYKAFSFSDETVSLAREEYEKTLSDHNTKMEGLEAQIKSDEAFRALLDEYLKAAKADINNITAEEISLISENMLSVEDRIRTNTQELEELGETEIEFSAPSSGAAKYTLLGFVLGGFLGVFAVCVAYLMSDKVRNLKDIQRRFGLRGLGQLPDKKLAKCPVDKLIDRLFGVKKADSEEDVYKVISANAANYISEDTKRILVTGSACEEDIKKLCDVLSGEASGEGFLKDKRDISIEAAKLITKPETIRALAEADEVILVEKAGKTAAGDIEDELILLKNLNKKVTGIALF